VKGSTVANHEQNPLTQELLQQSWSVVQASVDEKKQQ
jgi:hypothetical protein